MSGWDGDALAGQMEDAMERAQQAAEERKPHQQIKPEDRVRGEKLEGLRLSRSRISEQLSRATNPAHREMLNRALESIEQELKEL